MKKVLLSAFFYNDKYRYYLEPVLLTGGLIEKYHSEPIKGTVRKLMFGMKLAFLLVFIGCMQVSAHVHGQDLFTLDMSHVSVDKVLSKVQKESNYRFFYNERYIKHLNPVSIKVSGATLSVILDHLLDSTVNYKVIDSTLVVIFPSGDLLWQQHKISGTVTDPKGTPLVGVTVKVKGINRGTVTDANGNFVLVVPDNATLQISYIGYQSQSVSVGDRTEVTIVMHLNTSSLNQVVVTALGINKQKRSLGYAVDDVSSSKLNNSGTSSMLLNLEGKSPGTVINASGDGFDGTPRVVIRGANSLSSDNQPLYVIDGMPMLNNRSLSESLFTNSSGEGDYGTPLSDINSNDIASITILKGVAASALYGARGANGVILITTKKGAKHGIGLSYTNSTTFQSPTIYPVRQLEYGQGDNGQYKYVDGRGDGINETSTDMWGPKYEGQPISQWDPKTGGAVVKPWLPYGKNNLKNFYVTGHDEQNYIALSSVTDKSNIRASLGYEDVGAIVPNEGLKRITGTLNSTFKVGKKVSVQALLTASNMVSKNRSFYGGGSPSSDVLFIPTNIDIRDLRNYKDSLGNERSFYQGGPNPYWDLYANTNPSNRKRFSTALGLTYNITNWLSVQGHLYDDFNALTSESIVAKDLYNNGSYQEGLTNNNEVNFESRLVINKNITRDLNMNLMLGGNSRQDQSLVKSASTDGGLLVANIYNLSNSVNAPLVNNSKTEQKVNSLYGALDLSYKDFAYLSVTGRNDWSSTLPEGSWSFFYPSVSGSFIFSDAFHLNGDIFSLGKLRASWGQVGNATAPYSLSRYITRSSSSYNGQPVLGIQNVIPALTLKPEMSQSLELGGRLEFLRDRISLDLSYYKTNSGNQLVQVEQAWARGSRYAFINAGEITNKGIEVKLDVTPIKTHNLTWNVDFNYSRNRGTVSGFPSDLVSFMIIAAWDGPETRAANGEPYGIFNGFQYYVDTKKAYANTPGMASDMAADGLTEKNIYGTGKILTYQGFPLSNQITFSATNDLGVSFPYDWTGGIYNTFLYKNFRLEFLFDFRVGGHIISTTRQFMQFAGLLTKSVGINQRGGEIRDPVASNGGYLFEGTDAETGKPNSTYVDAQTLFDNWYFANSTYLNNATNIRLRELSLGYNIPSEIVKKVGLSSAEFSIITRNLWLIKTGIPGMDTETANMGALNNGQGFEYGALPNTKSVGFSLNIGF